MGIIGQSVLRKEGYQKVTGKIRYLDDLHLPNMIYGATIRSTVPRGKIKEIRFGNGIPWDEFTIVTARDIPGENVVALIAADQPYLASDYINHAEEPVILIAHPDRDLLERARTAITIEVDPLPAVLSLKDAISGGTVIHGTDNVMKSYEVLKGNVDSVWASADVIVTGEYETGAQEQLYIEPQGVIAEADGDRVTVRGSLQCPYYVHKSLKRLFNLPSEKVRVIQTATGGGFGGKEEYPSVISGHAALLALKSGRPVKLVYDRAEDMAATTKRHPSLTRHRTAVDKSGRILAMDIEFVIDGGAYVTLSPVVLSRGTIHAAGPYLCENVRIKSRAMATNYPPHGAFRGFGAPQSIFALERHMNRVAAAVGLTPEELRRRNFIKPGQTTATGQIVRDQIDLDKLLANAEKHADYDLRKKAHREFNAAHSNLKKGIGLAVFMHGAGFTGSGEAYLQSRVAVEANAQGEVTIKVASAEIGQGANTILSQIVAETLGVDFEMVNVTAPDTSNVPDSGPTVASRTSMIVGKLVENAARDLLKKLGSRPAGLGDWRKACADYLEKNESLEGQAQYEAPPGIFWDDEKYQGDAYGAFAWAVYIAEVTVDLTTYQVTVDDFVALQEIGRVLNPVLAGGQIEGGVAQAIGYALYEKVVYEGGRMKNNQMTNYVMPTSEDVPPIRVFFEEIPYEYGPGGAKGIGELPMDGPAPAILNAIEAAVGISPCEIPLMPEMLMELVVKGGRA